MIASPDAEETARRRWLDALELYADHTEQCDAYVADLPCGGCAELLRQEQESYRFYFQVKTGGHR